MNQTPQQESHELVHLIQSGDGNAETVLYKKYQNRLTYFVYRKLYQFTGNADQETCKDICQDAWIAVLENLRHGSVENPDRLSAYIHRVFSNKVVDAVKKLSEEKHVDLSEDQMVYPPPIGHHGLTQVQREMFTNVWNRLRSKERKILYLKYVEGWSHSRISQILGIKEDNCRKTLQRARERIIKKYGKTG